MKNVIVICCALFCLTMNAQGRDRGNHESRKGHEKNQELTPEQVATLKTKQMTLHLDLNETQAGEINKIMLDMAIKRKEARENRKDMKEISSTERFEKKSAMLDGQIEFKKRIKAVLNKEQFEKLEKSSNRKGRHKRGKERRNHKMK